MTSKIREILARASPNQGESLHKRSSQKDQECTTNFTNLVKNTREQGFWENINLNEWSLIR